MQCTHCNADNPEWAKFCIECSSPLQNRCRSCGVENPPQAKFCGACGASLAEAAPASGQAPVTDVERAPVSYTPKHLAEKILTSRAAMEGERKQVTVLFCDLANSTALAESLDPEIMHTLLNQFFELASNEVHRYEGTINQFLGDGFMALFGAPIAYEDHARRAVLAAIGLQQRLKTHRLDLGGQADVELAVRMGLNTGLVVVGSIGDNLRMDYTAVGDTTNLAARLQQLAEPGVILVSEATRRLVGSALRVESLEPLEVKGKTEAIKTRTFATLNEMTLKGSRRRPLIMVVEDLHWIDKTSEDYFASLVENLAGAPILLLVTYRQGYTPPWMEKSYATQIALRRLGPKDGLTVVNSVLQHTQLPEALLQAIQEKAEGIPFFLEELTRAVVEQGDDRADVTVPDTIQGVLMARIDRLPDEPKRLLQTASVLGREAPRTLLDALWAEPDLEAQVAELKRLELLYERIGAEEPVYIFKHALTQEVAYESLLVSHRQALHSAAGQAMEKIYEGRLDDVCDRLAYHYSKTTDANKAIDYLTRLADKAANTYANAESASALQEALIHVESLPEQERDRCTIDLVLRLARPLYFLGRFQDTLDLLLPQQDRLERMNAPELAGPYYFWLGHTYDYMGDQEQTAASAQRAIEAAQQCADEATEGKAYYLAGT